MVPEVQTKADSRLSKGRRVRERTDLVVTIHHLEKRVKTARSCVCAQPRLTSSTKMLGPGSTEDGAGLQLLVETLFLTVGLGVEARRQADRDPQQATEN